MTRVRARRMQGRELRLSTTAALALNNILVLTLRLASVEPQREWEGALDEGKEEVTKRKGGGRLAPAAEGKLGPVDVLEVDVGAEVKPERNYLVSDMSRRPSLT
jgi:hypothetical protein